VPGKIDYNDYNAVVKRIPQYRNDFRLFAREQLRIPTKPPIPRIVSMAPFPPTQELFVRSIENQRKEIGFIRQVWLKQRQQMGSSAALATIFHMAAINPYTHTFTATHDIETSEVLFRTVKLFYESLHPAIRPETRRATVRQLVFEDEKNPEAGLRSSMSVDTAKKINMAIGRRLSALHFSEVARYEMVSNREQVKYAVGAALGAVPLSPGTCVIMESTAFVTGAFFKEACERARRNEGAWRFVFIPWFVSPEYRVPLLPGEKITPTKEERRLIKLFHLTPSQIKYRRFKIAEFHGDESLFLQDFASTYDEAWIVTGHSVFPPMDRRKLEFHVCDPARFCEIIPGKGVVDVEGGPLWIWKTPDPECEYDIAVDVAMDSDEEREPGDNVSVLSESDQDFSAIQVLQRGTLEQVAEWRGRVHPIELAELAATLGYYYNTAQIAPESKGIGVATTGHLSTVLRYPNIYRWRYRDRAVNALTKYQGWDTSPTSKQYLVAFATSVVRNRPPNEPLIHSKRLFGEIETFVRVGFGRYEAAADFKDDLCMSWMIALVTSNDEDYTRFLSGEDAHEEKVVDQFYEPGKAPRRTDIDPAYTDADVSALVSLTGGTEVDGW
jgi:hypothetical protein